MPYVEFPLEGILTNLQALLELYIIDPVKYGSSVVNMLTNFVEILLKGFLVSKKIERLPEPSSRRERKEWERKVKNIKEEYNRKHLNYLKDEIVLTEKFNSKAPFLEILNFLERTKNEYRNEYTHEFFSYKMDIPQHTISNIVNRFLDFLNILTLNWSQLKTKLNDYQKLQVLAYFITFEMENPEQRKRALNEAMIDKIEEINMLWKERAKYGYPIYLGEEIERVRRLMALYELNISDDDDFCFKVLGYDIEKAPQVISIMENQASLTFIQIRKRLRERGLNIDSRELKKILGDLSDCGKVLRRHERNKVLYSLR